MNKTDLKSQISEAILKICEEMTNRAFEHTMKGKKSIEEVTKEDWDNASFTFEELANKVSDQLLLLIKKREDELVEKVEKSKLIQTYVSETLIIRKGQADPREYYTNLGKDSVIDLIKK